MFRGQMHIAHHTPPDKAAINGPQMRVPLVPGPTFASQRHVFQLKVQELVHGMQLALHPDVVLELDRDFPAHQGFEEAIK